MGRPVTIGEVFIKTHTKKDGSFVDRKAQKVAETYQNNKQVKLTDLGNENSETSDGTSHAPQLSIEKDNELFLQVNCLFYLLCCYLVESYSFLPINCYVF